MNDYAELLRTDPRARRSAREGTRRAIARLALVRTTPLQRVRLLGGSALEAAALESSHPPCHPGTDPPPTQVTADSIETALQAYVQHR